MAMALRATRSASARASELRERLGVARRRLANAVVGRRPGLVVAGRRLGRVVVRGRPLVARFAVVHVVAVHAILRSS